MTVLACAAGEDRTRLIGRLALPHRALPPPAEPAGSLRLLHRRLSTRSLRIAAVATHVLESHPRINEGMIVGYRSRFFLRFHTPVSQLMTPRLSCAPRWPRRIVADARANATKRSRTAFNSSRLLVVCAHTRARQRRRRIRSVSKRRAGLPEQAPSCRRHRRCHGEDPVAIRALGDLSVRTARRSSLARHVAAAQKSPRQTGHRGTAMRAMRA